MLAERRHGRSRVDQRCGRRRYRVVFTPATGEPGQVRRGTIVAATEQAARVEAQGIARDGGTARVEYVEIDGSRTVIGRYQPRTP